MLAIVAYKGFLTLLDSAVAAMKVISREQPEVLEFIKTLTEPYSASFPTIPFEWPLPSRPAWSGYSQPLLQNTWGLAWQLDSDFSFLVGTCEEFKTSTWRAAHNPCCKRHIPVLAVWLRFLIYLENKWRNLSLQKDLLIVT